MDRSNGIAKFSLEGLSLKGRILTDGTIGISLLLVNCILDDTRKGREDKLNRMLERKQEENTEDLYSAKSMVDVTFQQKDNDTFGNFT